MRHNYSMEYEAVRIIPLDSLSSERYRMIRNQDNIRRFFFNQNIITPEQQEQWYERYLCSEGEYMFSVLNKDEAIVGGCGIYNIDTASGTGEFGRIAIDHAYAGRGYGYSALKAAMKVAEKHLGLSSLILKVVSSNNIAIRMYEKAGFRKEADGDGIIRMKCRLDDLGQANEICEE